jgi:glycosyltransferase involved in cell wall biosynthesis
LATAGEIERALTGRRAVAAPVRVALVHDWLTGMRGGERCLEVFCELFPDAPLYTLLHVPGSVSPLIERLRGYDLVVSLSHCVAKGVRIRPGTLHVCYCFTPMRYVWDLYDDYAADAGAAGRLALSALAPALRWWDRRTAGVHHFVGISHHIADRIRRVYGRTADVLHPPVDVARFTPRERAEDFYLVVSALVPYKRVDLAVGAAMQLGRRLLVVGTGPDAAKLQAIAGPTVEFLGWRSDEEVARLYERCRAVLFTAVEDYGIVPLEAAAAGCPTIALGRGGVLETMVGLGRERGDEAPTALFFERQTVDDLADAMVRFEAAEHRFEPKALRARAERFDRPHFVEAVRAYLDRRLAEWRATGAARC